MNALPDWAARLALAEALRAVGLPWVPSAAWRQPRDAWMTYGDTNAAIELELRVVAEARRQLPAGVSGVVIDREFRAMAWRCVVAGMALLDDERRSRLPRPRDDAHDRPADRAMPVVIRRRVAEAPMAKPEAPRLIRRRGEAAHVS